MTKSALLSTKYEPSDDNGYIYGCFYLQREGKEWWEWELDFTGHPTMAIVLQNIDTTKTYGFVLQGEETKLLQMIAVPPGNYRFDTIEYFNGTKVLETDDFKMRGYQIDFVVEPNTAVYVGDFSGEAIETTTYISSSITSIPNQLEDARLST